MKTLYYILPIAAAVMLSSCEKDEVIHEVPFVSPVGGMSAKVGGALWTSEAPYTQVSSQTGRTTFIGTSLVGSTASKQIVLTIKGDLAEGVYKGDKVEASYSIDNLSNRTTQNFTNDGTKGSATVTITEIDKVNKMVSGTFTFTAKAADGGSDLKKVTEGMFTDLRLK